MQHTARTNYVRFENLEGLKQKLAQLRDEGVFEFAENEDGQHAILLSDPEQSMLLPSTFTTSVMPFVAEGEVLIVMHLIADGLDWLDANAYAFRRQGKAVHMTALSLSEIYSRACAQFDTREFTLCEG